MQEESGVTQAFDVETDSGPAIRPSPRPVRQEVEIGLEDLDRPQVITLDKTADPCLVALNDDSDVGAEKFRTLAVRLRGLQQSRSLKKILITSSIKGEGKSVVSANLALTLARRHRTLLVDGDLRQSGLAGLLQTHAVAGLADWGRGGDGLFRFLWRINDLPLWLLPAGEFAEEPLELIQSPQFSERFAQLTEHFAWVVIDSPPLVPVADAQTWAAQADASLLVVREATTPKQLLKTALESAENLKLLGIVMNDHSETSHPYYGQYYRAYGDGTPKRQQSLSRPGAFLWRAFSRTRTR